MCISGGIKGVLSGKYYNKSWIFHECFAEKLNRLFLDQFKEELTQPFPGNLGTFSDSTDVNSLTEKDSFRNYEREVYDLTNRCLQQEFGKTE